MLSFLTTCTLSNKEVVYKELKLKDYKIILKCLLSDPLDTGELILNLNNILVNITNLSGEEILDLNLIEYLLLLVNIRSTSIGGAIFATHNNEDRKTNIEISLKNTIIQLQALLQQHKPALYKNNDITLMFDLPKIKDVLNKKTFLSVSQINKNNSQTVDELPVKYIKIINEYTDNLDNNIKKFYFFKSPEKQFSIKLSVNIQHYLQIIKILFNENIISIYDNIFYLSKLCNMSSEYLENITYGEFKIYVKKAEEILFKNIEQTAPETINNEQHFDPVDIDALYGNDDFVVSKSEFTP